MCLDFKTNIRSCVSVLMLCTKVHIFKLSEGSHSVRRFRLQVARVVVDIAIVQSADLDRVRVHNPARVFVREVKV